MWCQHMNFSVDGLFGSPLYVDGDYMESSIVVLVTYANRDLFFILIYPLHKHENITLHPIDFIILIYLFKEACQLGL